MKKCTKCKELKILAKAGTEKERLKSKIRNQRFREKNPNYDTERRAKNSEKIKAVHLKWVKANPEKIKEGHVRWEKNNPKRVKENHSKWAKNNPKKIKEARGKWAKNNPERVKVLAREWRKENPEMGKASKHKRRARKLAVGGSFTAAEIKKILKQQKGKCIVCKVGITKAYHIDHIMPLMLEGSNNISNIQLLCQHCNLSKGAKHPIDFMQENGFLL